MLFDITELTQSYQYPLVAFKKDQITSANPSAVLFLGKALEAMTLTGLLGAEAARAAQDAFERRDSNWSRGISVGGAAALAVLVIINGEGYIAVKPENETRYEGLLLDVMLSDMGQLMKDPLENLYSAIQQMEKFVPGEARSAAGLAKQSFYALACLSEMQTALAPSSPLDDYNSLKLRPVKETVEMIAEYVNETLCDRKIVFRIIGGAPEKYCFIHEKKLICLMMLLFSYAIQGMPDGKTVNIPYGVNGGYASFEVPVAREIISLFDFSDYISAAGTAMAHEPLENQIFAKIVRNFNNTHNSKIFPNKTGDGQNMVIISLKTEEPKDSAFNEPDFDIDRVFGGLRPDLMFLSRELKTDSYI